MGSPPPRPGLVVATANVTATACPTTEGSGVSALMLVVVDAAFTVCATLLLVLPPKLPVALVNVAVNARDPADVSVMLQLVAGKLAVQVSLPPAAEIVTDPPGVPLPGLVTATANVTATA